MKTRFRNLSPKARACWLGGGLLVAIALFFIQRLVLPSRTVVTVAPGLTLTTVEENSVRGPLKYYLVTADPSAWHLAVKSAGPPENAREPVPIQAAAANAPIAVNGSYFFYDGPAVGPLKLNGKWHLLPWSDRTSLGLDTAGKPHIGPVTAQATLTVGHTPFTIACMNGYPDNRAKPDALSLFTPEYGTGYLPGADEEAVTIEDGTMQSLLAGASPALTTPQTLPTLPPAAVIPPDGYLLLARGSAVSEIVGIKVGDSAKLTILTSPKSWTDFPTILGGGPRLIKDGQIDDTESEEQFKPDVRAPGPRTALGIDADGNLLILVVDGWSVRHPGITLPETAALLQSLGAQDAMNFDGGSSTTLVVNGQIVDEPDGPDGGTAVSNTLLLMPGPDVAAAPETVPTKQ